MKKIILTSIFSLFILAMAANACDPVKTAEAEKASCCSSEATALTSEKASECADEATATAAIQTSESQECCDSAKATAVQTSSAEAGAGAENAGCNSSGKVKTVQTSEPAPGECVKIPSGLRAQRESR